MFFYRITCEHLWILYNEKPLGLKKILVGANNWKSIWRAHEHLTQILQGGCLDPGKIIFIQGIGATLLLGLSMITSHSLDAVWPFMELALSPWI